MFFFWFENFLEIQFNVYFPLSQMYYQNLRQRKKINWFEIFKFLTTAATR